MVSLAWSGINYSVGDKQILKSLSGRVEAGGTLAILGPSGSGKTSLLNVLGGMIKGHTKKGGGGKICLEGTISVGAADCTAPGEDHSCAVVGGNPASGRLYAAADYPFSKLVMDQVAIVEQYDHFDQRVTVLEHLRFHAALRLFQLSVAEQEARIRLQLKRLRLEECQNIRSSWYQCDKFVVGEQ